MPTNTSQSPVQKAASRGCGTLFFGVFAIMGLLAGAAIAVGFANSLPPYFWTKTPCTIVESHRAEEGLEATSKSKKPIVIKYRYNFQGSDHTSDRRSMGIEESLNARRIEKLLATYFVGARTHCYVNGSNPNEAVLIRSPLWPVVFMFIPLIFVAIGVGGIIGSWRNKPLKSTPTKSRNLSPKGEFVGKLILFSFFGLGGAGLVYWIGVLPVLNHHAAKSWPEVPCEILSSTVGRHSASKGGTTYSVDITYRYTYNGHSYQSDTYDLMTGESSGYDGKAAVVKRYPRGSRAVCYVNPADPSQAVINRELSWELLFALIPGLFLLVGVVGVWYTLAPLFKSRGNGSSSVLPGAAVLPPTVPQATGPVELSAKTSPLMKLAGALFIAIFWNGITGIFVGFAVKSWIANKPEWFLTIFITPFVIIGLGLIGFVGVAFLNLFNPRLRLTVGSQSIPLGGVLNVTWAFSLGASRIRQFRLVLEGREEATYRSGKHHRIDKSVFASLVLADTSDSQQIAQGQAVLSIPENLMYSWSEEHNKIVWSLKAYGDIPRFPNVEEEYEVTVTPRSTN